VAGKTKAETNDFVSQPNYDPSGKGIDYGGDTTEYESPAHDEAQEKGYYGYAPGEELDGDLTVQGVADRDVVAEQKGPSGFKGSTAAAVADDEANGG